MKPLNAHSRINTDQVIANGIVIYLRSLKFTIPFAIVLFIIFYIWIYKIPDLKHPDLSPVFVKGTTEITYSFGNKQNEIIFHRASKKYYSNLKVFKEYDPFYLGGKDWDTDRFKQQIMYAYHSWKKYTTKLTIIISLSSIFVIPGIILLIKGVFMVIINFKNWVNKNKTI